MAKPSRRARNAPHTDIPHGDIFAHFAANGRLTNQQAADARGDGDEEPNAGSKPVDSAELLARISRLEEQNTALLESQRRSLAAPADAGRSKPDYKAVKLDLTKLPDPIEHQAEHAAELQRRIDAYVQAKTADVKQELTEQNNQSTQAAQLWNGFKAAHPDWAEHEELVGTVAARVTQRAAAQGLDPQKYMFNSPQLFYADIVKELDAKYKPLIADKGDEGEGEGDPAPEPKAKKTAGQEDDAGRTAGIFGGLESGGKPAAPGKPPAGDMIADLHAMQRKSGYY